MYSTTILPVPTQPFLRLSSFTNFKKLNCGDQISFAYEVTQVVGTNVGGNLTSVVLSSLSCGPPVTDNLHTTDPSRSRRISAPAGFGSMEFMIRTGGLAHLCAHLLRARFRYSAKHPTGNTLATYSTCEISPQQSLRRNNQCCAVPERAYPRFSASHSRRSSPGRRIAP
jgi:hypothetical protein